MEAIGAYEVVREVARGGAGTVYQALAPDGRAVAVKLLHAGFSATEAQRRRFALEVQALLRIRHPRVVSLLDAGEHEGTPFLVLEWVEGQTLAEKLRAGPLEPAAAARLGADLARALAHCHAQGVVHRDLSPKNVLLRRGDPGEALVTDFGLARDELAAPDSLAARTETGTWLGTPGWWSPEQARGERAGPAADVWGLGALLFGALCAQPPVRGATPAAQVLELAHDLEPPGRRRPGIPPALDAVCARCLVRDAERRPTLEEVAAALEAWLREQPGAAGRRSSLLIAATVALVLGLTFLAGARWGAKDPAPPARPVDDPLAPDSPRVSALLEGELDREGLIELLHTLDLALARDPEDARLLALRGEVRRQRGERAVSEADLARACRLAPSEPLPHLVRCAAALEVGDLEGTIAAATSAIALAPEGSYAYRARSEARRRLGDLNGALADATRSIELDAASPLGFVLRAEALLDGDELQGAIAAATSALALRPDLTRALATRGEAHRKLGAPEEAAADASRVLALEPSYVFAWRTRAEARLSRDDFEGAIADATRALELDPASSFAWFVRAEALRRSGDLEGALDDVTRALELDPRMPVALATQAEVLRVRGDLEGALAAASRSLEIDPGNGSVWAIRANARQAAGDPQGALSDVTRALELEPGLTWGLCLRAELRLQLSALPEAGQDLARALEQAPDHPHALVLRAELRRRTGDMEGALEDAGRAQSLAPGAPEPYLARAELFLDTARPQAAREELEQARTRLGRNPQALAWATRLGERLREREQSGR